MGKIRVKTFEEASPEEEAKLKAKREAKKAEKIAAKNEARAAEGKKINPQTEEVTDAAVIASDSEPISESSTEPVDASTTSTSELVSESTPTDSSLRGVEGDEAISKGEKPVKKVKKEKFAKAKAKTDSKRHKTNLSSVSRTSTYTLAQALEALKKFKTSKFDETVELHINTKEKGVSGQVVLPHGTGKTLKIKIADDQTLAEVEKGKINFDILVATPSMMPKLAKVARVLGPRGLMPNPKNGTITDNPDEAVKKLSGGQIAYKTESAAPVIHAIVGKVSFDDKKLSENITTFLSSVGAANINSVTLKSTMSPGIKIGF